LKAAGRDPSYASSASWLLSGSSRLVPQVDEYLEMLDSLGGWHCKKFLSDRESAGIVGDDLCSDDRE